MNGSGIGGAGSQSRRLARNGCALFAAICLLCACTQMTPQWDAKFGDSVRSAVAQQTIDPEASRNDDPVAGIDGRAAHQATNRYQKSFQEPPPPAPLFQVMGAGGGGQ